MSGDSLLINLVNIVKAYNGIVRRKKFLPEENFIKSTKQYAGIYRYLIIALIHKGYKLQYILKYVKSVVEKDYYIDYTV